MQKFISHSISFYSGYLGSHTDSVHVEYCKLQDSASVEN